MPTIIGTTAGSDNLVGTSGDDVFQIEGGNDSITGNGGTDTLDFHDAKVGVDVDITKGTATGWGAQTFTGISNLFGSPGNDTLIGGPTTTYISGGVSGNDVIQGGDSGAFLVGGNGSDTITGGAGNDDIIPGTGSNKIDGGGGFNTIDYRSLAGPVGVDLYAGGFHSFGQHDTLANIQNIYGNDAGDTLEGDLNWNIIVGGAGADSMIGREGNDTFTGGGGNDTIDGGQGQDTAVYSGNHSDYTISANAYGWVVQDNRAGSPDGTDILRNVESLQFADGAVQLGFPNVTLDNGVSTAIENILRMDSVSYDWSQTYSGGVGTSNGAALANYLSEQISTGAMTESAAIGAVIKAAADTSSVATLSYEFFTGSVPTSGGMDFLVKANGSNSNNLNASYYQTFNIENRFINFAVNLGTGQGAGAANFQSHYASLTLNAALDQAYFTIFGEHPTTDKINALLTAQVGPNETRADYFAVYGSHTDLGTKAAMVGWLLAQAVKQDVGNYALSNDAYLHDVAAGTATFGIDIIGHYNQPGFAYTG